MQVRIFCRSRNVMQSGLAKAGAWVIQPTLPTSRRPDRLMGWVSARDTQSTIKNLKFSTKEDAVAFARKQGWDIMEDERQERIVTPRNYVQNFKAWLTEKA